LNQLGVRTVDPQIGFGPQQIVLLDGFDRPLADVGPVRPGFFCYRQRGKLVAVETATASRLWQRYDVSPDAIVSGDDEFVLLYQMDSQRLEVLRAVDGKTVGFFNMPSLPMNFLQQTGRTALVAEQDPSGLLLKNVDLVAGKILWEREFPAEATPFAIDSETVGAVDPTGKLQLLRVESGKTTLTGQVELPVQLTGIHVVNDLHRVYVVLSGPLGPQAYDRVNRVRGGYRNPLVNGTIYAFDRRDGRRLWQRTLEDVAVPLDQPREVPLLVMYSGQSQGEGNDGEKYVGIVEFFDKRTGERVYETSGVRAGQAVNITANVEQAAIELKTESQTVRLQFSK
jgi:hypothetical protein